MNRRSFLALAASGLLVPEWLLDPPKGRSMVSVPGFDPWWEAVTKSAEFLMRLYGNGTAEVSSDFGRTWEPLASHPQIAPFGITVKSGEEWLLAKGRGDQVVLEKAWTLPVVMRAPTIGRGVA